MISPYEYFLGVFLNPTGPHMINTGKSQLYGVTKKEHGKIQIIMELQNHLLQTGSSLE